MRIDAPVDFPVREAAEPHVALALILDVSGSMEGAPINSLNAAVNGMINQMKEDSRLRNIIDLGIFVFGTQGRVNIHQGFKSISDCEPVYLDAKDVSTYVVDALEQAVRFIRNRCNVYAKGGGSYKPWIVMITDGELHDSKAAINKIGETMKQREQQGKLQFFALGVGDYKREQLEKFTNNPAHVIDAKVANFGEFFSWVGRSLSVVSTKEIGDNVALPPLQFDVTA